MVSSENHSDCLLSVAGSCGETRQQGENIATFITALMQFTEHCAFGAALDFKLHDQLVCGIGDGKIQHHAPTGSHFDGQSHTRRSEVDYFSVGIVRVRANFYTSTWSDQRSMQV